MGLASIVADTTPCLQGIGARAPKASRDVLIRPGARNRAHAILGTCGCAELRKERPDGYAINAQGEP